MPNNTNQLPNEIESTPNNRQLSAYTYAGLFFVGFVLLFFGVYFEAGFSSVQAAIWFVHLFDLRLYNPVWSVFLWSAVVLLWIDFFVRKESFNTLVIAIKFYICAGVIRYYASLIFLTTPALTILTLLAFLLFPLICVRWYQICATKKEDTQNDKFKNYRRVFLKLSIVLVADFVVLYFLLLPNVFKVVYHVLLMWLGYGAYSHLAFLIFITLVTMPSVTAYILRQWIYQKR
jgi:hypothetical protein